jgi:anti-anti-sigma factor
MINYRTERLQQATVIRVSGEIDLSNAHGLAQALEERADANHLIVDLAGVGYLDLSGVKALEHMQAMCQAHGRLLLVTSPSLMVRRLFRIIDFEQDIHVFDSREEALAYLQGT